MRVTQTIAQTQFLTTINALESSINDTQNQISSSKSFTTAAQNPTAAGRQGQGRRAFASRLGSR